jgi:hypothetical protein
VSNQGITGRDYQLKQLIEEIWVSEYAGLPDIWSRQHGSQSPSPDRPAASIASVQGHGAPFQLPAWPD